MDGKKEEMGSKKNVRQIFWDYIMIVVIIPIIVVIIPIIVVIIPIIVVIIPIIVVIIPIIVVIYGDY